MKTIIVINGIGGSGKDTLIQEFPAPCANVSSIDPIKKIAKEIGWNGVKDVAGRRFLSQLKQAADEYDDFSTKYLLQKAKGFLLTGFSDYLFVHIREPENIHKFVEEAKKELPNFSIEDIKILTLLVKADWTPESLGNPSDDRVTDYPYDIIFHNSEGISGLGKVFFDFIKEYINNH